MFAFFIGFIATGDGVERSRFLYCRARPAPGCIDWTMKPDCAVRHWISYEPQIREPSDAVTVQLV